MEAPDADCAIIRSRNDTIRVKKEDAGNDGAVVTVKREAFGYSLLPHILEPPAGINTTETSI